MIVKEDSHYISLHITSPATATGSYFYCYSCSFNDLMQYPVFPWVINVYEGNHLDLNDVNTYRKLNKPIACQKTENEEKYKMHYAVSQLKTEPNIIIHIRFIFLNHMLRLCLLA